ncbi:MAG: response regulator transcription factor [Rhodoferax sp.]|jgi:two-component system nitrate/nitrite response regulator NarL|nr:response regulator transcription factor [Rhodoferax sp.]
MDELDGFSILLVDDHTLFRVGLGLALTHQAPQLQLTAVASLDEAMAVLRGHPTGVDLVLIDYRLPGADGLQGAIALRAAFPQTACALMSGADDPALPEQARRAGLAGFFHKSLDVGQLLVGLRRLCAGDTVFPAVLAGTAAGGAGAMQQLTERQREVLRWVAAGATNKEIAASLGIAPHTVKNHLGQILERLGATNRAQAAAMAQGPARD